MKLIIGANGKVGSLVVRQLREHRHEDVRVFVRDEARARQTFGSSVEVAQGDLDEPRTIAEAMSGVSRVLICSPVHPNQVRQHNAVIDAARHAGQPFVVKVSGLGTAPDSYVDSGRWHAQSEAHLAESGLPFTCLRPLFFMQNLLFQAGQVRASGVLKSGVTEHPIAMIDARDIASVIVRLFEQPELALGQRLTLTGAESLSYEAIAGRMAAAWDRPVEFVPQTREEIQSNLERSGQPEWHINILLQFNRALNEGMAANPDPSAARILSREPLTLEQCLTESQVEASHTDAFPS